MPELCRLNHGISIQMCFGDHWPPHFHVILAGVRVMVAIDSLEVLRGELRRTELRTVREWGLKRQTELRRAWELAVNRQHPGKIDP